MFKTVRIFAAAAAIALLAATGVQAAAPKDPSTWYNGQADKPTGAGHRTADTQFAARAGNNDKGASAKLT